MEDDFDYREYLEDIDAMNEIYEELMEEELVNSWTLVLRDNRFAIFADYKGETRIINENYINMLFSMDK